VTVSILCVGGCWNFFEFFFVYATWIEPRIVATLALAVRRSNHSARSYPNLARSHPTRLDIIPLGWISSHSAKSHPTRLDLIPPGWISSHSAGSHPTRLDLIPLGWISSHSARSHPTRLDLIPLVKDLIPIGWISL
jgi:hypothetical protein